MLIENGQGPFELRRSRNSKKSSPRLARVCVHLCWYRLQGSNPRLTDYIAPYPCFWSVETEAVDGAFHTYGETIAGVIARDANCGLTGVFQFHMATNPSSTAAPKITARPAVYSGTDPARLKRRTTCSVSSPFHFIFRSLHAGAIHHSDWLVSRPGLRLMDRPLGLS
jgi:hypothetical protein